MHVCLCVCVQVCLCACVHVCMCACLPVCMCACVPVCMSACVPVCMCLCACVMPLTALLRSCSRPSMALPPLPREASSRLMSAIFLRFSCTVFSFILRDCSSWARLVRKSLSRSSSARSLSRYSCCMCVCVCVCVCVYDSVYMRSVTVSAYSLPSLSWQPLPAAV